MPDIPWVIEDQTRIKLALLKSYISPWMNILYQQQEKIRSQETLLYLDGFSGPGVYFTDESKIEQCDGSPVIVAKVANEYLSQKPSRKFHLYALDKEQQCVDILGPKLSALNSHSQNWKSIKADFESAIHTILDEIESKGLHHQPMFFFIDPFGYKGFTMDLMKRVLSYKMSEVFVNFMIWDIVRFFEADHAQDIMKALYGSDIYHEASKGRTPQERYSFLLNKYCEQLKAVGGTEFVLPFKVYSSHTPGRVRFYLIHASKNYKALQIMKDRMAKVEQDHFQFRGVGHVDPSQLSLFEDPEIIELKNALKSFCAQKSSGRTYDDIERWAYIYTKAISKEIKEALVEMEKASQLVISRQPRAKTNTVTSGAFIKVP